MMESIVQETTNFISFSNALSGAAGAAATLLLTCYWRYRDKNCRIESLCNALRTELQEDRSSMKAMIAMLDDKDERAYFAVLSFHQNYTTVYDSNTESIGFLGKDASISIVKAYSSMKILMDRLQSYTSICQKSLYARSQGKTDNRFYNGEAERLKGLIKTCWDTTDKNMYETIRLLS